MALTNASDAQWAMVSKGGTISHSTIRTNNPGVFTQQYQVDPPAWSDATVLLTAPFTNSRIRLVNFTICNGLSRDTGINGHNFTTEDVRHMLFSVGIANGGENKVSWIASRHRISGGCAMNFVSKQNPIWMLNTGSNTNSVAAKLGIVCNDLSSGSAISSGQGQNVSWYLTYEVWGQ